ncbi:type VI secretion system Vgr family protein [Montanilutibacter psychrotolerans]|uniref:type VI secretion system Vgr family protein n=1 Tax=Montanilutibacter psychrotolerans TaxID=1327343 RepID=UPI003CCE39AC
MATALPGAALARAPGLAQAVSSALAGLARYTGAQRLYDLAWGEGGATDWVVERWQGWETLSPGGTSDGLSGGFEWWIDALSTNAGAPLDRLLGQRLGLLTRSADGSQSTRTGLIREAQCIGGDGGLARYRVCLVPWTWLLGQGRHSRVFQERSVSEIVASVFAGYAPLAAWQFGDEVGPFLDARRPRSYCVQYRESDLAFVSRLLAEEGLGWRIEEAPDAPAGHRIVVFAESGQGPQDAAAESGGGIRYHRSDATEASDTVQAFGLVRRLGSAAVTVLSDDYKAVSVQSANVPLSGGDHAATLEDYDPVGAYAFADRNEADHYAGLLAQARQTPRRHWLGQGCVRSFRAGSWFALRNAPLADGTPDEVLLVSVHQAGVNNLPAAVREGVEHALGAAPAFANGAAPALPSVQWQAVRERAAAVGYANAFTAVPRDQPWRPVLHDGTGARINPRPTAPGYQTAIVVGPEASDSPNGSHELHCDRLGRVRVRFHFQQSAGDGEAADSCWLRVAQRYAGPGVGSQFLPRIGQEVLVAFLDGDIDRPMVVGALYNGHGEAGIAPSPGKAASAGEATAYTQAGDHRPSAQANLAGGHAPPWHGSSADAQGHRNAAALVGIKSKEFGGEGHNRLVLDDSDGQLRLQLATTHAATQLNLGHLIHQADNFRGSFRGEGFELRSDQWGAVRAQAGLWLSAYAIGDDTGAGDAVAATALLKQATALAKTFSQVAGTHKTVKLAAHEGASRANQSQLVADAAPLAALLKSASTTVPGSELGQAQSAAPERSAAGGSGRVPHSGDALLGLAAPAGIGMVAGQSVQWLVGETLSVASGQSANTAVAGNLRIHAGQAIGWLANAVEAKEGGGAAHALALVAGEGKLEFEAQHDSATLQSRDALKVVSANAQVELAAGKTVHLATAGGASITIEGGNIVVACPGNITVHAGKKSFLPATQLSREMNTWPQTRFNDTYVLRNEVTDEPLANVMVELTRADGAKMQLVTDAQGRLPQQKSEWMDRVVMRVMGKAKGAKG